MSSRPITRLSKRKYEEATGEHLVLETGLEQPKPKARKPKPKPELPQPGWYYDWNYPDINILAPDDGFDWDHNEIPEFDLGEALDEHTVWETFEMKLAAENKERAKKRRKRREMYGGVGSRKRRKLSKFKKEEVVKVEERNVEERDVEERVVEEGDAEERLIEERIVEEKLVEERLVEERLVEEEDKEEEVKEGQNIVIKSRTFIQVGD